MSHTRSVAVPLKKPVDTGYPKYPGSVFTDVPVETPLLKVNDYGPLGARFFWTGIDRLTFFRRMCTAK